MMPEYDEQRVTVFVLHKIPAQCQIRLELWHEGQRDGERNFPSTCTVLNLAKLLTYNRCILQGRGELRAPFHCQQLREADARFSQKQRGEAKGRQRSVRATDR